MSVASALARLDPYPKTSRNARRDVFFMMAQELRREKMSFRDYIKQAWPIVEPAQSFKPNWHIDCIAEHLEAVTLGQIKRLVINIYPRVGKSLLASVLWPTWAWTQRPWLKQIFLSYSARLSTKFSVDRRSIIESPWYENNWGNTVKLMHDQNQKAEFVNTARGMMFASSIGGTVTGEGGDIICIDDGIDPQRADSKAEREEAIRFVKNTVSNRLNNSATGAIVNIDQRTAKQDISGTLLAEGGYIHLNLPAIAESRTVISFPLSKKEVVREEGDVLFPEHHSKEQILDIMSRMTPRAANAQYKQKPDQGEASMFKRDKWKFYSVHPHEMARSMDRLIQSWDLTFKGKDDSDFVAGAVIGKRGGDIYFFDMVNKRMGYGATKIAIKTLTANWPRAHRKLIEGKANGPAIIEELSKDIGGIEEINPEDSKPARAQIASDYQECGNVYLPDPKWAPWVGAFMDQCEEFSPTCANDDMVDVFSQAVIWFKSGENTPGVA